MSELTLKVLTICGSLRKVLIMPWCSGHCHRWHRGAGLSVSPLMTQSGLMGFPRGSNRSERLEPLTALGPVHGVLPTTSRL